MTFIGRLAVPASFSAAQTNSLVSYLYSIFRSQCNCPIDSHKARRVEVNFAYF